MSILRSIGQGLELVVGTIRSRLGDPNAWEPSMRRFEAQDRANPPVRGGIVFVGSSSFTLWATLEQDMAPLPALNRGFGGALIGDVVRYADRIVLPYAPRAVVVFAGTNDIAGRNPASAQYVADSFDALTARIWATLPETVIFYVAITPSRARWKLWPIASEANRLIHERVRAEPRLRFIDLTEKLIGPDGLPDRGLYRVDKLHPNNQGYVLWASAIKSALEAEPSISQSGNQSTHQQP